MTVAPPPPQGFEIEVETLIVGAGACGLVAALSAQETGQDVLVLERDPVPRGSTALSAGLIPAAGTAQQRAAGIEDTADAFAADIQRKANGDADPALVAALTGGASDAIGWLTDTMGLPLTLVDDFDYPGHSARRMHGLPDRSGAALVDALRGLAETRGISVVCDRRAEILHHDGDRVRGVTAQRPDGAVETVGARRVILACNGYGASRARVARHMPAIADALYFGHPGNEGHALDWAEALDLRTAQLGAYQGHGNVAHPHGILVTWAVITGGGIQVDETGARFWNEAQGYSEAAAAVLARPGGTAVTVFDGRLAAVARQFADFREAEAQGSIRQADTPEALARVFDLPVQALVDALSEIEASRIIGEPDRFGRHFGQADRLEPPYCAVRVTGALFHSQGGIAVDAKARALTAEGRPCKGLFAGGGAAVGVSGPADDGYLSGNGLLSAVVLGRIAGLGQA